MLMPRAKAAAAIDAPSARHRDTTWALSSGLQKRRLGFVGIDSFAIVCTNPMCTRCRLEQAISRWVRRTHTSISARRTFDSCTTRANERLLSRYS